MEETKSEIDKKDKPKIVFISWLFKFRISCFNRSLDSGWRTYANYDFFTFSKFY